MIARCLDCVCLTSGRQEPSSPSTQFALAMRCGTETATVYSGKIRVRIRIVTYPDSCSLKNCIRNELLKFLFENLTLKNLGILQQKVKCPHILQTAICHQHTKVTAIVDVTRII